MSLKDIKNQIQKALNVFLMPYPELIKNGVGTTKQEMNDIGFAIFSELKSAMDIISELGKTPIVEPMNLNQFTIPADVFLKNEDVRNAILKNNPDFTLESLAEMNVLFINPKTGDVFKKHAQLRI